MLSPGIFLSVDSGVAQRPAGVGLRARVGQGRLGLVPSGQLIGQAGFQFGLDLPCEQAQHSTQFHVDNDAAWLHA